MGLLAIASMGAMQVMVKTTKTTKTSEIGLEVNGILNSITQNLLSSDGCTNTFKDLGPISDSNTMMAESAVDVPSIKNRAGKIIYDTNKKYGNNRLKIDEMNLQQVTIKDPQPGAQKKYGEFRLQIKLEKQGKGFYGQKIVTKNIPIQGEFDLNNNLTKCYSATEDAVLTAKKESCEDIGGTWSITADTCDLSDDVGKGIAASTERVDLLINELRDELRTEIAANYVLKAGDTMTGNLQVNAEIKSNNKIESATQICVNGRCRNFNQALCPQGKVVSKINEDGSLVCSNVTCPNESTFFVGTDASGNPICKPFPTKTCSANQYVSRVYTDGSVRCTNLPPDTNKTCSSGTAIRRILSNGTVTCITVPNNTNVFGKSCSSGQTLRGFYTNGNPICNTPRIVMTLGSLARSPRGSGSRTSACPYGYEIVGCLVKSSSYFRSWPYDGDLDMGMHHETGDTNERMFHGLWGLYKPTNSAGYCRAESGNWGNQLSRTSVQAVCAKIAF